MFVRILGGPYDGLSVEIPRDIGEGQKFLVEGVEYFAHKSRSKVTRLIYYRTSMEA